MSLEIIGYKVLSYPKGIHSNINSYYTPFLNNIANNNFVAYDAA